jgi:hypothetical protein
LTEADRDKLLLSFAGVSTANPVRQLNLPPNTPCGSLTTDANNAIFNAVAYTLVSGSERARYGKAAAQILNAWATTNEGFSGPNGFLCAAWNVGAMARAAFILKQLGSPEYAAIQARFEAWAEKTAQTYWLPIDATKPLPGSKPQLLQRWELEHVSNRSLVSLEATLHVARLRKNAAWFQRAVAKYKQFVDYKAFRRPLNEPGAGTTYFVDATGKNNDHFRGDPWHRTAGLASSVHIAEVVKLETGEDLFRANDSILKKSLELYSGSLDGIIIPFWSLAAQRFPESEKIRAVAQQQARQELPPAGSNLTWKRAQILQYCWGRTETLKAAQARPATPATPATPPPSPSPTAPSPNASGIQVGGTCYPVCASTMSDPDRDGWGWEASRSCVVKGSRADTGVACGRSPATTPSSAGHVLVGGTCYARCDSASADPDGDGWGWQDSASCVVTGSRSDTKTDC